MKLLLENFPKCHSDPEILDITGGGLESSPWTLEAGEWGWPGWEPWAGWYVRHLRRGRGVRAEATRATAKAGDSPYSFDLAVRTVP